MNRGVPFFCFKEVREMGILKEKREKCRECLWYEVEDKTKKGFGICHFYPPLENGFPLVRGINFCSKFEEK
jgi:hypothetical protein